MAVERQASAVFSGGGRYRHLLTREWDAALPALNWFMLNPATADVEQDEPTNHLDVASREGFEGALDSYEGAIVSVTHDRYYIERFAGRLLVVDDGSLTES